MERLEEGGKKADDERYGDGEKEAGKSTTCKRKKNVYDNANVVDNGIVVNLPKLLMNIVLRKHFFKFF